MIQLDPTPSGIRLLRNDEIERLRKTHPKVPMSPERCVTCKGEKTFQWWVGGSDDRRVETYQCNCIDQWSLHLYFLSSNIGLVYQRIGWGDVQTEPGALAKVEDYLSRLDAYMDAGCGLILHGSMGTGKTMLSTLILKAALAAGYDGYFTTFSEMIDTYSGGWYDTDEKTWFHRRIKNADILIVDDVGKEHRKTRSVSWAEAEKTGREPGLARYNTALSESTFDDVLRHRVANASPTIITTNLGLEELQAGYGGNVMSLLHERSTTYRFTGEDFRDSARMRLDDEIQLGLTRPVVIG